MIVSIIRAISGILHPHPIFWLMSTKIPKRKALGHLLKIALKNFKKCSLNSAHNLDNESLCYNCNSLSLHLPSSFLAVPLSAPTICASVLKDPLYDGRSLDSKESFKAFELASSFFVSVTRGWTGLTVLSSICKTCELRPSEWVIENNFSHFSIKTYVVGTQKNRLNETVLLSTQNTCLNR